MEYQANLTRALIDRYAIEREIGSGGMATVFLARDLKHGRQVAIKVLDPDLAQTLGAERFLREIETAANLTHPHILPLFDSGEADGFLYYVMPFVKGESLGVRLEKEKQLPVEDAVQITREIADALAYAHEEGVIHRDVKPGNIMLEAGHAVLADFGVAHAVAEAKDARLTRTGTSIGTPAYMSPEQATGERDLDGRSDQYALGCVLYEMLAGHPPFTGAQVEAVVRRHLTEDPPSVTRVRPSVAGEVSEVIKRALSKSPADRFRTTGEMAAALALTTAPVRSVPKRPWRVVGVGLLGAAALAAGLAVAVSKIQGPAAGIQNQDELVVVLSPINETGDPSLDYLGNLAAVTITEGLEWAELSRVVNFNDMFAAAHTDPEGEEVSSSLRENWPVETGASLAVVGSYYPTPDSVQFRLRVINRAGEIQASIQPVSGSRRDPSRALQDLNFQVATSVAGIVSPGHELSRLAVETHVPDRETLELYLEGRLARARVLRTGIPYFERALEADPQWDPPFVSLMIDYSQVGRRAQRDSICENAQDRIRSMPRYWRGRAEGSCLMVQNDYQEVLRVFRELVDLNPNEVGNVGTVLLILNRPAKAVENLLKYDPDAGRAAWEWFDHVLWNLGLAYHRLGNYEDELRVAYDLQESFPDQVNSILTEIRALAGLGRLGELQEVVEEWTRLRPPGAFPDSVLSIAAAELDVHGNPDEGGKYWEQLLRWLESTEPDPAQAVPSRRRTWGRALLALGRLEEARPFLEGLAAENPENLIDLGRLGVLKAKLGDRPNAERLSERLAAWGEPESRGQNTVFRARIHANLGNLDAAVELLEQAMAEDFRDWDALHRDLALKPLRGYQHFEAFMEPWG